MKVSIIDAGHFDALTAYAAINTLRLDDMRPHIFRTHDGGKTWTEIVKGIPDGAPVDAVREDPKTQGPAVRRHGARGLRLVRRRRQLAVAAPQHGAELRARHHRARRRPDRRARTAAASGSSTTSRRCGRSTPKVAAAPAFLFKPQTAIRVRWNMNTDTPLPPDEPASKNPPDGAILNYYLGADATRAGHAGDSGRGGRRDPQVFEQRPRGAADRADSPGADLLGAAVRTALPATAGMHRYTWDMHYTPLPGGGGRGGLPIAAIAHDTAADAELDLGGAGTLHASG